VVQYSSQYLRVRRRA